MRIVAAHPPALGVCFIGRSGGAGMLVAERYVILDEVADRLHPRPAGRRIAEQAPRLVAETIGLAVPAAEQKQDDFRRQVSNLVLHSVQFDRVRQARVTYDGIRAEAEMPGRCNEAAAPIAKTVAVAGNGNRRVRYQIVRTLQFGDAREVHVQRQNHRRRLRKIEMELATEMNTHEIPDIWISNASWSHMVH